MMCCMAIIVVLLFSCSTHTIVVAIKKEKAPTVSSVKAASQYRGWLQQASGSGRTFRRRHYLNCNR
eukprot:GSA25T00014163001.1